MSTYKIIWKLYNPLSSISQYQVHILAQSPVMLTNLNKSLEIEFNESFEDKFTSFNKSPEVKLTTMHNFLMYCLLTWINLLKSSSQSAQSLQVIFANFTEPLQVKFTISKRDFWSVLICNQCMNCLLKIPSICT